VLFNSLNFLLFFPVVVLIYFVIPKKVKNIWLLVSSYYFYMSWNPQYALLILVLTFVTYVGGLLIAKLREADYDEKDKIKRTRVILAGCVIISLGFLFYFKYFNFAIRVVNKLFHLIRVEFSVAGLDIILPIGISFYTLQAIGYIIDVYRGDVEAERSFIKYALFVSFFPQLVAGPIERSKNLIGQFSEPKRFSYDNFREGILIMIWGFFLKLVIADRISGFVDTVFLSGGLDSSIVVSSGSIYIAAALLFAIQIYCDFYGYSTIALGAAKILGVELIDNFASPFFSTTVSEFWRRWHISLNNWFRDYLYIPLGGNRKGKVRKTLNTLFVFLISGLWHGDNFTYIIWGGLNGVFIVLSDLLRPLRDNFEKGIHLKKENGFYKFVQRVVTFCLFSFSLIFFRASSLSGALYIIRTICTKTELLHIHESMLFSYGLDFKNFIFLLLAIALMFFADAMKQRGIVIRKFVLERNAVVRCLFIAFVVVFILIFGKYGPQYDSNSFIYFQF